MVSISRLIPCQPITHSCVKSVNSTTSSSESEASLGSSNATTRNAVTYKANAVEPVSAQRVASPHRNTVAKSSDPIDLSRPRSSAAKPAGDAASFSGTAGLLKTLMSLSDKVPLAGAGDPATANYNIQNPNLLQSYLTERALQKSKMKLSQMAQSALHEKAANGVLMRSDSCSSVQASSFDDTWRNEAGSDRAPAEPSRKLAERQARPMENGDGPRGPVTTDAGANEPAACQSPPSHQKGHAERAGNEAVACETAGSLSDKVAEVLVRAKSMSAEHSSMETLADIAAHSAKLAASKASESAGAHRRSPTPANAAPLYSVPTKSAIAMPTASASTLTTAADSPATAATKDKNAKNIASKYLQMANKQDSGVLTPALLDESSSSSEPDQALAADAKVMRRPAVARCAGSGAGGAAPDLAMSAQTVVVGKDGFQRKSSTTNDLHVFPLGRGTSGDAPRPKGPFIQNDGGPCTCEQCGQTFQKQHQLTLHMNIHYMNPGGKFRCETCCTTFNTRGLLQKHLRSEVHNSSSKNPRPFECTYCKRAFRIQGHLAKHLRSKTHVQRLECLQKLPFGTYNMIEEARIRLTDIDTTDCDSSLASLKTLADQLKTDSGSPAKLKSPMSGDGHHSSNDATNTSDNRSRDGDRATMSDNDTDDALDAGDFVAPKKRKLNDETWVRCLSDGAETELH